MFSKTLLAARPVYKSFSRTCYQKNIETMSWKSDFMKRLVGINIGMFAWAYYINSKPWGENLRPAEGRCNPLEVN